MFLVREAVVAITDVELAQPVEDMVLQSWYKILTSIVNEAFQLQYHAYLDCRIATVFSKEREYIDRIVLICSDMVMLLQGGKRGDISGRLTIRR